MNTTTHYGVRVAALREEMRKEGLDAYLLPTSDAFQSEYLPPESRHMEWLCGFSGENGIVIITEENAATFVDGRFTVQITQQAPADIYDYCHIHDHPPRQWLSEHLKAGSKVGLDGYLHTAGWFDEQCNALREKSIELVDVQDNLVNRIWLDRPEGSHQPVILLETAGKTSLDKRLEIAATIKERGCHALLTTHPECTNWLLNIRGRDIPCTPVLMSYALLYSDGTVDFFTDTQKLTEGFLQHVGEGVNIHNLETVEEFLSQLDGHIIHVDRDETPARLFRLLEKTAHLKEGKDPCLLAKARKNIAELEGFRRSHIRDGIAMCRFLAWLDREVASGAPHDEGTLADKVESLRQEQDLYLEPSFETISSLGPNAAMCHYNHKYNTPRTMGQDGVYLLDSGGQYLDGTTDITRTIRVGEVTNEYIKMCTLVLKGHIGLAMIRFPAKKTTGLQLDMAARLPLWMEGFDYDHGTGHGIGHCLGVHEFPGRFSNKVNSEPLEAGMVMTIEPGYYRAGEWGIRHENQYELEEVSTRGELKMLGLRHMTFVPIDTRLLDKSLMTTAEVEWLNDYHQQVFEKISPALDDVDRRWLKQACQTF